MTPAEQVMGKNKILVKVHPEGKYVVDLHKDIDINKVATGARVALRNDSYTLHLLLPTKVDPLVSLMKVEKVPDSTYDMIGGLDQQIKEIKEVTLLHFWLALLADTLPKMLFVLMCHISASCSYCQLYLDSQH